MTAPTTTRCDRCGASRSAHEPGDLRMPPASAHPFVEPRPEPPVPPRRIPEWMQRMQAGQLKAKDLTGSVAL